MKIKYALLGLMFISIFSLSLSAKDTEPSGVNILNPAYLQVSEAQNIVRTKMPIPLEEDSAYSFAVTNYHAESLRIWLDGTEIVYEDDLENVEICDDETNYILCTFDATDKEYFEFEISGGDIARAYILLDEVFMLQEGSTVDWYEPFEPLNESEPVITGGSIYLDYREPVNLWDFIGDKITAYDDIDGDLTDDIIIVNDTYKESPATVGEYEVIYEVTDSAGNVGQLVLDVFVLDQVPPTISGPSIINVDVDDPLDIVTIVDNAFSFYDDHDGPISDYEILQDEYSDSMSTTGSYTVELRIADSSGNPAEKTFDINVRDTVAPEITGPNKITMKLSEPYQDLSEILNYYTVSDNYTNVSDMELVITDFEGPNSLDVTGQYAIGLEVSDCSGNKTQKIIELDIIDDVPPILEGESHIQLSYTETFDVDAYIASMQVSDNHDALSVDDIVMVESNYEPSDNEVGRYNKVFMIEDYSGNTTTFTLIIDTIDDIAPYFIMEEPIIVAPSVTLSQEEVFTHLLNDEAVAAFTPTSMTLINDEYSDHKTIPGTYEYHVLLSNDDGETMEYATLITVRETDESLNRTIPLIAGFGGLIIITSLLIIKRRK